MNVLCVTVTIFSLQMEHCPGGDNWWQLTGGGLNRPLTHPSVMLPLRCEFEQSSLQQLFLVWLFVLFSLFSFLYSLSHSFSLFVCFLGSSFNICINCVLTDVKSARNYSCGHSDMTALTSCNNENPGHHRCSCSQICLGPDLSLALHPNTQQQASNCNP